jgi:hypothetical protein
MQHICLQPGDTHPLLFSLRRGSSDNPHGRHILAIDEDTLPQLKVH